MSLFALISQSLDPSGTQAKIVHELFASDPNMHPDVDIRDVTNVVGIAVGWIANADGTYAPYVPPAPTKGALKAYAANARFNAESRGTTLNGAAVATDRDSQSMIANALSFMSASNSASINFKTPTGFVTMTLAQVQALGVAVGSWVQACFAKEASVDALIDAGTITTTAAIDAAFINIES